MHPRLPPPATPPPAAITLSFFRRSLYLAQSGMRKSGDRFSARIPLTGTRDEESGSRFSARIPDPATTFRTTPRRRRHAIVTEEQARARPDP